MQACPRCNRIHVGALIFATPMTLLFVQQSFEQWCDIHLDDSELAKMTFLPSDRKWDTSSLRDFMGMVHAVSEKEFG